MFDLEKVVSQSMRIQDKTNQIFRGTNWLKDEVDWIGFSLTEIGQAMSLVEGDDLNQSNESFSQILRKTVNSFNFMLSYAIERGVDAKSLVENSRSFFNINALYALRFHALSEDSERRTMAQKGFNELSSCCLTAKNDRSSIVMVFQSHLKASSHIGFGPDQFIRAAVSRHAIDSFRQGNKGCENLCPKVLNFEGKQIEDSQVAEILIRREPSLASSPEKLTALLKSMLLGQAQNSTQAV